MLFILFIFNRSQNLHNKVAFIHARRGESRWGEDRLASLCPPPERRGEATFASSHLCVYGPASTSGATTIQSYKNGGVSFIDEYSFEFAEQWLATRAWRNRIVFLAASLMYVCFHYERIAESDKRCRSTPRRLVPPRLTNFDSLALFCSRVHRAARPRLAYVWMPLQAISLYVLKKTQKYYLWILRRRIYFLS